MNIVQLAAMVLRLFIFKFKICSLFILFISTDCLAMQFSGAIQKKIDALVTPLRLLFEQKEALFKRDDGFWTKKQNEENQAFFGKLTESASQRESWYQVSPYMAEFYCAISNVGFFAAGLRHKSPELLFAGLASFASHSIPKQWLLLVDKLGAAVLVLRSVMRYKILMDNPWFCIPAGLVGVIFLMDIHLARTKGKTWPHVLWHLSAALAMDGFLTLGENRSIS